MDRFHVLHEPGNKKKAGWNRSVLQLTEAAALKMRVLSMLEKKSRNGYKTDIFPEGVNSKRG